MRAAILLILPMLLVAQPATSADGPCTATDTYELQHVAGLSGYSWHIHCDQPWGDYLVFVDDVVSPVPCFEVELLENNTLAVHLWGFQVSSMYGDSCFTTSGRLLVRSG